MANEWFQFRQFMIRQDRTAMKVGTDGVLLGAWADCSQARRVVDAGTGTGLIALMLIQRFPGMLVDAIELDHFAAEQAAENFRNSPWPSWINPIEADFLKWSQDKDGQYDHVVCNPPYFRDALKASAKTRTMARHEDSLPLRDLIGASSRILNKTGSLSLILPVERLPDAARASVDFDLNLNRILRIKATPEKPPVRVLLQLDKTFRPVEMKELVIEAHGRHGYSDEYYELTRDFYL